MSKEVEVKTPKKPKEAPTLTTFKFDNHDLTSFLDESNEPWILAKDVCEILGYANVSQAISDNCRPKGTHTMSTPISGGYRDMLYINEGNLYRLILKSTLPAAKQFEELVMDEILPSIRKKGFYESPAYVQMKADAAKAKRLAKRNEELADRNEYLEGKAAPHKDDKVLMILASQFEAETQARRDLEEFILNNDWEDGMIKFDRRCRTKFVGERFKSVARQIKGLELRFKGTEWSNDLGVSIYIDQIKADIEFARYWK